MTRKWHKNDSIQIIQKLVIVIYAIDFLIWLNGGRKFILNSFGLN